MGESVGQCGREWESIRQCEIIGHPGTMWDSTGPYERLKESVESVEDCGTVWDHVGEYETV